MNYGLAQVLCQASRNTLVPCPFGSSFVLSCCISVLDWKVFRRVIPSYLVFRPVLVKYLLVPLPLRFSRRWLVSAGVNLRLGLFPLDEEIFPSASPSLLHHSMVLGKALGRHRSLLLDTLGVIFSFRLWGSGFSPGEKFWLSTFFTPVGSEAPQGSKLHVCPSDGYSSGPLSISLVKKACPEVLLLPCTVHSPLGSSLSLRLRPSPVLRAGPFSLWIS